MIEKRTFAKGMNQDLAESLLEDGMYRYALNFRNGNSEKGAVGTITNAEGNQEVSFTLPSGANRVIGAYDDEANDRVIYIVQNSEGDNRVLSYSYKLSEVNTILSDSGNILNVSPERLITGINVISGNGTSYLLFTDDFGEPKNIDIDQGIRTYDTIQANSRYTYKKYFGDFDSVSPTNTYEGEVYYRDINVTDSSGATQEVRTFYRAKAYTTTNPTSGIADPFPNDDWEICPAGYIYGYLNEESLTAIVAPHVSQPVTAYSTSSNDYNYLAGNLWQFKVKYVRADGRESSWSPISAFVDPQFPVDSVLNQSTYINANKFNNQIEIFSGAPDPSIYKTVKVAVRRALNDTSPYDWTLAGTIDVVSDITAWVYDDTQKIKLTYDAATAPMPLDTNDTSQLMSWIPPKAKAQAVTSRNRVLYANFTEGKPYKLDGQYSLTSNPPNVEFFERDNPYVIQTDLNIYTYDGTTVGLATTEETLYDPPIEFASGVAIKFPTTVQAGRRYVITVPVSYEGNGSEAPTIGQSVTVSLRASTTVTNTLVNRFITNFNNNIKSYLVSYGGKDFDKYLLQSSSASSGGNDYLILQPTAAETVGGVTVTPLIRKVPQAYSGSQINAIQSFKRGTSQTFALAYSDKYGRLTTAIEHPQFTATNPWWRDSQYSGATGSIAGNTYNDIGQRYANISLNHDAPSWATSYHILKTNNNGLRNYVSFVLATSDELPQLSNGEDNPITDKYFFRGYVKPFGNSADTAITQTAASIGGEEQIYFPLTSLQGSQVSYTSINNAPLAYDFVQGDRLRMCYNSDAKTSNSTSDYYESVVDAQIVEYSPEYNYVSVRVKDIPAAYRDSASDLFGTNNEDGLQDTDVKGLLIELYSPQLDQSPQFYYEMYTGAVSADTANSRYYHVGNDQTQTSAQSAIIELANGDCFMKARTYTQASVNTALSDPSQTLTNTYYVEEANYFDKIPSKTWGAGRPNRSIKSTSQEEDITGFLGEAERPTTIRYSEPFLPDRGYNGLGTIFDLNFKDANGAMKSIQHLHTEGSRAIIFHENAVGLAESDRAVVTTLDDNDMTIGANTPLSDVIYYSTRAGIGKNPESFAYNNNRKYFVDIDQGQVNRLSQDGVTPISEQGMNKYFKETFREMINSPQPEYAYGAYDKRTDEYTLVLKWASEVEENTQADVTAPLSAATLQYTFDDITQYDFYVGQSIAVETPAYSGCSSTWNGISDDFVVSGIEANTVTWTVASEYQNELNCLINDVTPFIGWYIKFFPYKSRTVTYSEKLKAWTSFHSFNAENIASAGLEFVSFRAGSLFIHNDYDNPMRYYGRDYPAHIDIINNQEGDQVKALKTLGVKATTEDSVIDEDDFRVAISVRDTTEAPEPINSGVMDSRGKDTTCTTPVYKEGQLYFEYLREGSQTSSSVITIESNSALAETSSGASLTVTYDTTTTDLYVGQFIDLQIPSFTDCAVSWSEASFEGEVTAFNGSSITFTIPTTYQSQVDCLADTAVEIGYAIKMTLSDISYANYIEGERMRGYWFRTRLVIESGVDKIYKVISANFEYLKSNYTR